jgi:hypothetical protein
MTKPPCYRLLKPEPAPKPSEVRPSGASRLLRLAAMMQPTDPTKPPDVTTGSLTFLFATDAPERRLAALMEAKLDQGREKYGVRLEPFNGRSALVDIFQELLDACNYAAQKYDEFAYFGPSLASVFREEYTLVAQIAPKLVAITTELMEYLEAKYADQTG